MRQKRISVSLIDWQYFWVTELAKKFGFSTSDFVGMCLQEWLSWAKGIKLVSQADIDKLLADYHRQEKANTDSNVD